MMLKSNLLPPHDGPNSDPVLYGVAAGLAELFPLFVTHGVWPPEADRASEGDGDREHGAED